MRTRSLPNTGQQRYLLSKFYRYVNEDGYDRLDGIVILYAVGHGLLVYSLFFRFCMYSHFALLFVIRRLRSSRTLSLMCYVRIGQRSHSGPPGCDAVQLGGALPTLRKETYPVYPKDGSYKLPQDVGTHLPSCRTPHCKRPPFIFLFECLFCNAVSATRGTDTVEHVPAWRY